jgi:hypothetical protein
MEGVFSKSTLRPLTPKALYFSGFPSCVTCSSTILPSASKTDCLRQLPHYMNEIKRVGVYPQRSCHPSNLFLFIVIALLPCASLHRLLGRCEHFCVVRFFGAC